MGQIDLLTERPLAASLQLDCKTGPILVHAVRGREALSEAYRYEIDFSTDELEQEKILRAAARFELGDDTGVARTVCGVVDECRLTPALNGRIRCRITVVPKVALLGHARGFRIFQEMSVEDIVKDVLAGFGVPEKGFRFSLKKALPVRTYCVQYSESPWAFINRLLESEGVFYFFEHTADGEVMVMVDANAKAPMATPDILPFNADGAIYANHLRVTGTEDVMALTETAFCLDDYNMVTGQTLEVDKDLAPEGVPHREWYEWPAGYMDVAVGRRLLDARKEERSAPGRTLRGTSNSYGLVTGSRFNLLGHPERDDEYLVTAVALDLRADVQLSSAPLVDVGKPTCTIRFAAIPQNTAFRAARTTPRPRIPGFQTARVTGPAGEEIHCDKYGRVKVQFHWDLDGQLDDKTSCWIRVAQAHTTGSVMIPRIGWEVIVQFEDGDPDRPMCLGRLYNGYYGPPVNLPDGKTISGHRSLSSPGGGGVNEVTFEDAAGSQKVAINGAHNIAIVSGHNKVAKIAKNETRVVGLARKEQTGAASKVAIKGNHAQVIGADQHITIGANRTVKVSGQIAKEIGGDLTMSVGGAEMMQVGNPAAAVLALVAEAAVSAAQAAASGAASRAEATLLGPIMPALGAAKKAIAGAERYAGDAKALLAGNPGPALTSAAGLVGGAAPAAATVLLGEGEGAGHAGGDGGGDAGRTPAGAGGDKSKGPTSPADVAADPEAFAAGMAGAVASGALSKIGLPSGAAGGGGGGGGAGGGGAGAGAGVWGVTVGKDAKETIGALAATNAVGAISHTVGGDSSETAGLARIELIGGGKTESTKGSKTEMTGVYMINASEGIAVDTKTATFNIAGTQRLTIGGGHAVTAKGVAALTAGKIKMEASEKITIKCGQAEMVISSSGIVFKGKDVTIEGTAKLQLDPASIGPV